MSEKTRKSLVIGLVVMTIVLIGAAVYLGITIQQNQAPTNSEAASGCIDSGRCVTGNYCGPSYNANGSQGDCDPGKVHCSCSLKSTPAPAPTPAPTPTPTPSGNACSICKQYSGNNCNCVSTCGSCSAAGCSTGSCAATPAPTPTPGGSPTPTPTPTPNPAPSCVADGACANPQGQVGCCGSVSTNDTSCSSGQRCGNGGGSCTPDGSCARPVGQVGCCTSVSRNDSSCSSGQRCGQGSSAGNCGGATCNGGTSCFSGVCGCGAAGVQCGSGTTCFSGVCGCGAAGVQCGANKTCSNGACVGTAGAGAPAPASGALCGGDGRSNCTMQNVGGCTNGQQRQTCYSNVNSSIGCYDQYSGCGNGGGSNPPPVSVATITCYSCTAALTDANACTGQVFTGSSCPAGTSASASGCGAAAGGSCAITGGQTVTCYRCSDALNDGNSCEPFTVSGTACIAGSSTDSASCAAVAGGSCPNPYTTGGVLPNTALISDQADVALLGGLMLLLGVVALRFHAIDGAWALANNSLQSAYNFYFGEENVRRRELDKLKGSRKNYEKGIEKKLDKSKQ